MFETLKHNLAEDEKRTQRKEDEGVRAFIAWMKKTIEQYEAIREGGITRR